MGAKPTTIGGGAATGVANDFAGMLHQALSGGFNTAGSGAAAAGAAGANPVGDTMNIGDALGQLMSGGQGLANSALAIGNNRREENVADLRSRYSMGGTGYGTPAAVGEARFLGEFDPQLAGQVGGLQMDGITKALGFLFPGLMQSQQLGTPQAQTVMKKGFLGNALGAITGLAGAAAPFLAPGIGSVAGPAIAKAGDAIGGGGMEPGGFTGQGQLGQAARYNFDGTHTLKLNNGVGNAWGGYQDTTQRNTFGQMNQQPYKW